MAEGRGNAAPPSAPRGADPPGGGAAAGDPRATAEISRSMVTNTQALVRKEIELAKLEISEIVTARLIAVGALVGAGVFGLFILGFVGVTGAKALELVVPEWAAWLIVTALYLAVAVALLLVAKRKASVPPTKPERTQASVKETIEWAKRQVGR